MSKKTISIIAILFIMLVASISIFYLFYYKDSNNQYDKGSHFVSIDGKGDYSSVQEAIDSASENETIFVSDGTYYENIRITKPLKLIGEDRDTTIISGNGSGAVISISADYVKISGFTITNGGPVGRSDAGIVIGSSYNTISDCMISSNKNFGIHLYDNPTNTNNLIISNIFSNNKRGIYTLNAKTNNISSNTFTGNTEYGMFLYDASNDNIISDNIFTENSDYALRIMSSSKNTVIKNLFMKNNMGLYFCCGANKNIAYNNAFIDNTNYNAQDDIGNTWDNGVVGNYWDDYTGADENDDGLGDSPYIISSGKQDNFPRMQPI